MLGRAPTADDFKGPALDELLHAASSVDVAGDLQRVWLIRWGCAARCSPTFGLCAPPSQGRVVFGRKRGMGYLTTALIACALTATACAERRRVITNNGIEVYERYWNAAVQSLSGRAQIDLGCTQSELSYLLISRQGKVPTQIMVEGCGRRGLYARRVRDRDRWSRFDASPSALGPGPAVNVTNNVQVNVAAPAE
jgi:hypothetical protein